MSLRNAMAATAAGLDAQRGVPRWGTVVSVDKANHTAKVMLQPEGVLSGWLPVLANSVGNGWGLVALPEPGQQVLTLPEYGDGGHPVIIGAAYSVKNSVPKTNTTLPTSTGPAPQASPVDQGEFALVHKSGSCFRICADGTIYIKASVVNIDGELRVRNAVTGGYGGHGSVGLLTHSHGQFPDSHGDTEGETYSPTGGT